MRAIDLVWLLLLGALAAIGLARPEHSPWEWVALLSLGGVQVLEASLDLSDDVWQSLAAIGAKFALCYWLVAETGGIESSYYLIFLLPIVSAAMWFGLGGTVLVTAAASGLYLSFLLFVLESYYVPADGAAELIVRVLFFFLAALLVNRLAMENRLKTRSLAKANRELQEAQDEVRRSERLAALGQLSAGLAHELRNPLSIISGSAEVLSKKVSGENEVAQEVATYIRGEVERANGLVTRFLQFARPSPMQSSLANWNETIERALDNVEEEHVAQSQVRFVRDLGDVPLFPFDRTLIESAVQNLVHNAYDAVRGRGQVTVRSFKENGHAVVEVVDNGKGIADEELESIFNPFFTTKPDGVGLGLAMVSKFVDSHRGSISVASVPGTGTTFTIRVPLETS